MDNWDTLGPFGAPPEAPKPVDPWESLGSFNAPKPPASPAPTSPAPVDEFKAFNLPSPGEDVWAGLGSFNPKPEMPGVGTALMSGLERAQITGEQTSAAIHGTPLPDVGMSPEEQRLNEPVSWGDLADTATFGLKMLAMPGAVVTQPVPEVVPKLVYGAARTAPELAAGTAGAIVGGAGGGALAGPPGALIGGTLGAAGAAGAMSAVQTLGPTYAQELAITPQDPDSAFDRAWNEAEKSGALSALTWGAFGINPFKSVVKNLLFQSAIVQPSIAIAEKAGQNQAQGLPWSQDVASGVPGAIANTLIPAIGFNAVHLLGKGEAGLDIPESTPETRRQENTVLTDTARSYADSQNEFNQIARETIAENPGPRVEPDLKQLNDQLDLLTQTPTAKDSAQTDFGTTDIAAAKDELLGTSKPEAAPVQEAGLRVVEGGAPVKEQTKLPQTLDSRLKEKGFQVIEGGKEGFAGEPTPKKSSIDKIRWNIHEVDRHLRSVGKSYETLSPDERTLVDQAVKWREALAERERARLETNVPKNTILHEEALRIGGAILEMRDKMGIKAPLTIHLVGEIPEHRDWFGYHTAYREEPFITRGQYFRAPLTKGLMEIAVDAHTTPTQLFATMAHEFGHFLVAAKYHEAPIAVKQAVLAAYKKWVRETVPSDKLYSRIALRDNPGFVEGYERELSGAPTLQYDPKTKQMTMVPPETFASMSPRDRRYWLNVEEFAVEQVAKWAYTHQAPRSIVEKWSKSLADRMQMVWTKLARKFGIDFRPQAEMGRWLDSLVTQQPFMPEVMKDLARQTQALNAAALKRAGDDPSLAVPQSENLAPARAAMKQFFEGEVPPRVEAAAAHADRYNWIYKWTISLQQLARINRDVIGLQRYREFDALMKLTRDKIMAAAHQTLRAWHNLGEKGETKLVGFIDDMMHMAYRTPEEAKVGVRRMPTQEEFLDLAKKHGMGDREIAVFNQVAADFRQHLARIRDLMLESTKNIVDPNARGVAVDSINKQIAEMAKSPYFPAMRFGSYWVDVRDQAGRLVAFHTFKKYKEAKKFREQENGKDGNIANQGVLPENSAPFVGMPPGLLEKIAEKLDLSKEQMTAISQLKYEYAPAQSFRHRLQKRMLVPGYSRDFRRAYANYFFHGANYFSKVKFRDLMNEEIKSVRDSWVKGGDKTKRQEIANFMQAHLNEVMNGKSDFAALRALTFWYHLGFLPAKAAVNMTQIPLMTFPFLSSKFGDIRAMGALTRSGGRIQTYYKKGLLEAAGNDTPYLRAMGELVREGVITEAFAPEVAAVSEGRNLSKGVAGNVYQQVFFHLNDWGGKLFGLSEQFNRRITAGAAYELALLKPDAKYVKEVVKANQIHFQRLIKDGFSEHEAAAIVTAKDVVEQTQGQYNREALPKMFWGKKRSLFAFQTFKQNMLFTMWANPGVAARSMLMMGLLGGAMGVPGAEDIKGLMRALAWHIFGKDFDLEREVRRYVAEIFGENAQVPLLAGPDKQKVGAADLVLHGLSRYGFGIPAVMNMLGGSVGVEIPYPTTDMSNAVGLGPIVPVDMGEIFGPPTDDKAKVLMNLDKGGLGATFATPLVLWDALRDFQANGTLDPKLLEKGEPAWMRALSKAGRYYREGMERAADGSMLVRFDPHDAFHMAEMLATAMGFNATRVTKEWGPITDSAEQKAFWQLRREILYRQLDTAIRADDKDEISTVLESIKKYNAEAPQIKELLITREKIRNSLSRRAKNRAKKEAGQMLLPESTGLYPEATIVDVQKVK